MQKYLKSTFQVRNRWLRVFPNSDQSVNEINPEKFHQTFRFSDEFMYFKNISYPPVQTFKKIHKLLTSLPVN